MDSNQVFLTKEEIDDLIDLFVNHPEIVEEEYRKKQLEKMEMVKYFYSIKPDRCGQVDFENNTVTYNDKYYTEKESNYGIEEFEDYIRIWDTVELDYEIRTPEYHDFKKLFTIFTPNTDEAKLKKSIAYHLHWAYFNFYIDLLKENGIDVKDTDKYGFDYYIPWSGCEKEIDPKRFSGDNTLLTDAQIRQVMKDLYPKAYKEATKKSIFELQFEDRITESGKKRICKAILDEERLLYCRQNGWDVCVTIDADEFDVPARKEIEDGREVYYLEFEMRHTKESD